MKLYSKIVSRFGQIAYLEEKVLSEDNDKHKLVEQNKKLETQCSQMDAIHQVSEFSISALA